MTKPCGIAGASAGFWKDSTVISLDVDVNDHRKPDYPVNPLLFHRWSARAMSGEAVSREELMTLFEAARWAPSCFNDQPWRFVYVLQGSQDWPLFMDLLLPGNRVWAERAGALVMLLSSKTVAFNGKPSYSHSFDAGAAWQNFALQAYAMKLVVHGVLGFDHARARQTLNIPDGLHIETIIIVGKPGHDVDLPEAFLKKERPSGRKPLAELVREGGF